MKKPDLWMVIGTAMINSLPPLLLQRIARATSESLNSKAINHQKMSSAEAKRERKRAKRRAKQ